MKLPTLRQCRGALLVLAYFGVMQGAAEARVNFGKQGDPIHLVVGFQPYYAESWSGVINNGKQFWKKYLPAGSTAEFQAALQGAIIVNAMTGEKQHIGYAGDMPSIAATSRVIKERGGTDIRIVAVSGTSKQQCNVLIVRTDAPQFKSGLDAVKWLAGKNTGSPHGACTDRFARLAFEKAGIKPATYLNQNNEVVTTNFRAGKIDGAVMQEPTAAHAIHAGLARRVATGEDFDALDGGFLIMLHDLIEQRPDVHRGWLESELDAQLFMADLNNAKEVTELVEKQTEQMERKTLWSALYGAYGGPGDVGQVKIQFDYVINDRVQGVLKDATLFLYNLPSKPVAAPEIRKDGVDDAVAREILKSRNLTSPVGLVKAQPMENFK